MSNSTDLKAEASTLVALYHFSSERDAEVFLDNAIDVYCPVWDFLEKPR
ncbi:hypothetical protein [Nocardia sp. NPDC051570]